LLRSRAECVPLRGDGERSGEGLSCCRNWWEGQAGDGGVDATTEVATGPVSQLGDLLTHLLPRPRFQALWARAEGSSSPLPEAKAVSYGLVPLQSCSEGGRALQVGQEWAKMGREGEFGACRHQKGGASSAFNPSTRSTLVFSEAPEQRRCRSLRWTDIHRGQLVKGGTLQRRGAAGLAPSVSPAAAHRLILGGCSGSHHGVLGP